MTSTAVGNGDAELADFQQAVIVLSVADTIVL
jgi:hypothetical protein